MAELADALDLGSSGQPWGFNSPLSHQESVSHETLMSLQLTKGYENVIPAQAGIQNTAEVWIPTFVGMTEKMTDS